MGRFRFFGLILGVLLGLGAPVGAVLFKWFFSSGPSSAQISSEIYNHFYYYFYMALVTPFVFAVFGYYLGVKSDENQNQKEFIRQQRDFLETQSMTDDITGFYNHRHLLEEIEKELERSRRHKHVLSALMVDVDNFKSVNDTYGHPTGDRVLREVAQVLAVSIRKIDIVGRYGGDEFVVILPEAGADSAETVANRVLENMRTHRFQSKLDPIQVTVSVGVATFSDLTSVSVDDFIERVDQVMFGAKSMGKDRVFYDERSA